MYIPSNSVEEEGGGARILMKTHMYPYLVFRLLYPLIKGSVAKVGERYLGDLKQALES